MKRLRILKTKKQKAQGMVEFALALPVFLLAVFGVIEFSRFFFIYSSVYTASREAARYGASVGVAADGVTPHDHDCAGIQQVAITQGRFAGISNVTVQIQNLNDDLTVLQTVACGNQTRMGDRVIVQVNTTFQPILGVIPQMPVTATANRTIMKEIDLRGTPPPPLAPATPFPTATANIDPYVEIIDDDPPDNDLLILRDYTSGVKAINANVVDFNPDNRIHTWTLESGDGANVSILSSHSEDTTVNFSLYGLYTFQLEVFDGQYTGSDTIQVLANIKPDVSAGGPYELVGTNGIVCSSGSPFRLNGSASDLFGFTVSPLLTTWNGSGPGSIVYNPSRLNNLNPYVSFSSPGTYEFTLTADDGYITSTSNTVSVPVNYPPLVTAAVEDNVPDFPAYLATFSGSATNPDGLPAPGGIVSYLWEKVSGPGNVLFADATSQITTATFSARGTYQIRLKASDGCEFGYSPNVTVHVNEIPVVNANIITYQPAIIIAQSARTATISGSVLDDGYPNDPVRLTHIWTSPDSVTISNPGALSTSISFATSGTRVMRLTANDGWESAYAEVSIINNTPPVANAGPDQIIASNAIAYLNGTGSDINLPNQTLTYSWTRVSGTGTGLVNFSNVNIRNPSVSFTRPGVYVLQLTVSDGLDFHSDQVTITKNAAPVATAVVSNSIIEFGESVSLDGKASNDPDNFPNAVLSYFWSKYSGPGSVTFTNLGATDDDPTASFSASGDYILSLRVYDGLEYGYAYVTVHVNPPPVVNLAPVANAGADQLLLSTRLFTGLSGSGVDDGLPSGILTYGWSKISGPGTASFSNATILNPTVTFSIAGIYELRLTVSDGLLQGTDTVIIRNNGVPIANAGPDRTERKNIYHTINGSAFDDGYPVPSNLSYLWTIVSKPSNGDATFVSTTVVNPSVTFNRAGTYVLRLAVNDGLEIGYDEMTFTVTN